MMSSPRIVSAAILLLTLTLLTLTHTGSAQTCETGALTRGTYRSQIAQTTMYYSVYTPPCYEESAGRYPVMYLMHGSNEDDGQWLRLGLADYLDAEIGAGRLPPLIAVLPFGEWIANANQFDRVSWSNVFLDELMPLVERQYRIAAAPESRVIGGISRGGFWAFNIAFRHPELFSAVGGHSAFFDPRHAPDDQNPLDLALTAPGLDNLRIWLDRGKDDFAAPGLDLMDERLRQRGLDYQYTIYPEGQHYLTYWRQHVPAYVQFYAAGWQADAAAPTPLPLFATNTPPAPSVQPTATTQPASGLTLFLPAVSFPSLRTRITAEALWAVRSGQSDASLVLDETSAAALRGLGVTLAADTQVIPDAALFNLLWRDRTRYTLLAFDRLTPRQRVLHLDELHPLDTDLSAYPFAFVSDEPNFDPDRLTRVLFSGVTALTRQTMIAIDQNGVEWAGSGISEVVDRADFFHTSNEVSFAPGCPQASEPTLGAFCSKRAHFKLFTDLGLDIVELSGNHNADYGYDAYRETLVFYRANGIRTVGGGENLEAARQPLILEHNGNSLALVSCNWIGPYYALASDTQPGAAFCDWDWLRATLPGLAADYDLLAVTVQYEEFEEYTPRQQQQSDFRGLADLGADIVLGTQAHKPQTFEFYNTRRGEQALIHYGLGNLFFDQPFWGNMRFFMDQVFVYEGRLLTVDLFTGLIEDNARPRLMTADEQFNFLAFMFNDQGRM